MFGLTVLLHDSVSTRIFLWDRWPDVCLCNTEVFIFNSMTAKCTGSSFEMRKQKFTGTEVEVLVDEVEAKKNILFGGHITGISCHGGGRPDGMQNTTCHYNFAHL